MSDDNEVINQETKVDEDAPESTEEEVKKEEESETQSESSTDKKSANQEEDEESDKSSKKNLEEEQDEEVGTKDSDNATANPKPVEGETPRERALRKEVERLKEARREDRSKDIFGDKKKNFDTVKETVKQKQPSSRMAELEKRFNPEELKNFKEALEVMAEEMGFAKKGEIEVMSQEEKAQAYLEEFLSKHPEYEKDDVLWNEFKTEYHTFYKVPSNPRHLPKIFERIHQSIGGTTPENDRAVIAAKTQKVQTASHSASKGTGKREEGLHKSNDSKLDPSLKDHLIGDFSDLDL